MKKLGNKSSGIYYILVNEKYYVGKDHDINRLKRIKEHKNSLIKNKHYNKPMQESYNENPNFEYGVFVDYGKSISDEELCKEEIEWIKKTRAYEDGWNQTIGGLGGSGIKYSKENIENRSIRISDDKNPMSKINSQEFQRIIQMIQNGKSNLEISKEFDINDRYVSLIRNKRRHLRWFEKYAPEYSIVSGKKFQSHPKLSDKQILEIKKIIQTTNETNVSIAKKYSVDPSTISRVRTKIKEEV